MRSKMPDKTRKKSKYCQRKRNRLTIHRQDLEINIHRTKRTKEIRRRASRTYLSRTNKEESNWKIEVEEGND